MVEPCYEKATDLIIHTLLTFCFTCQLGVPEESAGPLSKSCSYLVIKMTREAADIL